MARRLILLPIDGSRTAEAAARFAEDIARSEGETILVLGVAVSLPFGDEEAEIENAVTDFMSRQVAEEAARIRSAGVAAGELVVDANTPQEGILRVADERSVDIIVMGTHGLTGWRRAVIGSVSDAVVRHASVPVVLVPLKRED